jgi:hypothetical protein
MQSFFGTAGDGKAATSNAGFHPGLIPAPRRRISPMNGRALETLGHAIEYLTDEYALSAIQVGKLDTRDPRIEAIQMLMALNRQIYYTCPEIEPALRRIARWMLGMPAMTPTISKDRAGGTNS